MRRISGLAASALLLLAAWSAHGQSLPSKKEVAAILAKAEGRIDLTAAGASPFHLLAAVRYSFEKTSLDGTYEIYWAGPDRYREEFRLGPINSDYVALHDKLYIARAIPALTYPQWKVRMLLGLPGHAHGTPELEVSKVYARQIGSENAICANVGVPSIGQVDCYSPTTKDIVFLGAKRYEGDVELTLREDNFLNIGAARTAGRALATVGRQERLEIDVKTLEAASPIDESTFAPPAAASVYDWCAEPEVGREPSNSLIQWLILGGLPSRDQRPPGVTAYYVQIGQDGSIKRLAALYQDGSIEPITHSDALRDRLPIQSCAGRPIEYETIFDASIQGRGN